MKKRFQNPARRVPAPLLRISNEDLAYMITRSMPTPCTAQQVKQVLDMLPTIISASLSGNSPVEMRGFAVFELYEKDVTHTNLPNSKANFVPHTKQYIKARLATGFRNLGKISVVPPQPTSDPDEA